jgi:hypothetical protein
MKTRNLGIIMDQGASFQLVILITGQNGPIDITGYEFASQMRATTEPSSPVVAEFEFEILNQTTNIGQVQMTLPIADDEENIIPLSTATPLVNQRQTTPFVFDVKMKDSVGFISRIIQGIIFASPEATQELYS